MLQTLSRQCLLRVGLLVFLAASPTAWADKILSVPKWQRFELTLKSAVSYAQPLQQAEVRVLFVSPLGETNRVYGFWDGGKTWRVRYQPGFPGRWQYFTMCSDTANVGLNGLRGEFLCTAATEESRFATHGPILVARDQEHFEHADRTPFLWLGDAAWNAAGRAPTADWATYVATRAEQKFNVLQWQLPAKAFSGRTQVSLNLEALRQLDAKIAVANRSGLLNAIAPLWEIGTSASENLPEDQAIILLRHLVGRWGAENVAWIVAFESDSTGAPAARWQRIGRAVFNNVAHAPVVLLPGQSEWVLDGFRHERWVDALGFQTTQVTGEDALPWLLAGPLALERKKLPARPLLTLAPPAETTGTEANAAGFNGSLARRLLWWSLLLNTPAGVSTSARDVSDWITDKNAPAAAQPWQQALSAAGAVAVAPLQNCFEAKEFWTLEPLPAASGGNSPGSHVAAVSTESHAWTLVYIPEDRAVTVESRSLPARFQALWFNPRTGESSKATVAGATGSVRFATPGAGDWLLVITARK